MNIFILDNDINKSVQYYIDRHVVKIPTEIAQLLCNARHYYGDHTCKYKLTHVNHPWSKFTRECVRNYLYVCYYGIKLCEEYQKRYGKRHAAHDIIIDNLNNIPNKLFSFEERTVIVSSEFKDSNVFSRIGYFNNYIPICVPEDCLIIGRPVESYRQTYIKHKRFDKRGRLMAKWKNGKPDWYKELDNDN